MEISEPRVAENLRDYSYELCLWKTGIGKAIPMGFKWTGVEKQDHVITSINFITILVNKITMGV